MKLQTAILVAMLATSANADDKYNLNLDSIKLNELTKIAYSEILSQGYVSDDDFNHDEKTITVRLQAQNKTEVRNTINQLIEANGYKIQKQGAALYISKLKDTDKPIDQKQTFYYQPKYRNTQYITDLVSSIFDKGRFTYQRAVQSPQTQGTPEQPKPIDTGTSAASQQSKNYDSFIFYGSEKEIAQLQKLLAQVDIPSGEILVKAFIYEVSNSQSNQTAFSAAINVLNAKLSINTAANALNDFVSFKSAGIEAVFSALATDNRFKVVSAPSLRVKDRENARFSVGAEVPILGAVSFPTNGQSVQSVEYKSSGVILDIRPTIRAESIELDIRQQLSNFINTTTGVNNSPTLIKRELSSVVNSQNDDVIILGGLEENRTNNTSSGQRWLPKFLRSNSDDNSKSDILLVLHVQRL